MVFEGALSHKRELISAQEQQKVKKERAKKGINWNTVGLGISRKGTVRERFSTVPGNVKKQSFY